MMLQPMASRNLMVWARRWKTPRSRASITSTKTLKTIQKSNWCKLVLDADASPARSASPPALAALPRRPHAHQLHRIVQMGFVQKLPDLDTILAGAEALGSVGDSHHHGCCLRYFLAQIAQVNLVVSVRHGVVVLHVVGLVLVGDQSGHAFQKKIEVVGAHVRILGHLGHAHGAEWGHQVAGGSS